MHLVSAYNQALTNLAQESHFIVNRYRQPLQACWYILQIILRTHFLKKKKKKKKSLETLNILLMAYNSEDS